MHLRIQKRPYKGVLCSDVFLLLAENAIPIPDVEEVSGPMGTECLRTPVKLKRGEWNLKLFLGLWVESSPLYI